MGCVGVLHDAFGLKLVSDLPEAYRQLLASGADVDRVLLENILKILTCRLCNNEPAIIVKPCRTCLALKEGRAQNVIQLCIGE